MQEFINRSKHKACISSVLQSNGNSIEFSFSTRTRRVIKSSQAKSLHQNSIPHLEHCLPWTLLILTLTIVLTLDWWSSQSLVTSIHSQALGLRGLISQLETEGGDAIPSSGTVIKARTCNWVLIDRSSSIHLINLVLVVHCDQYMQRSNAASLRRCLG